METELRQANDRNEWIVFKLYQKSPRNIFKLNEHNKSIIVVFVSAAEKFNVSGA